VRCRGPEQRLHRSDGGGAGWCTVVLDKGSGHVEHCALLDVDQDLLTSVRVGVEHTHRALEQAKDGHVAVALEKEDLTIAVGTRASRGGELVQRC